MSKLLIADHPLQVLPKLAVAIGLNEAIFLQQLHYWIQHKSAPIKEGRSWHYESYEQWLEQFPFWSSATLRRLVETLRKKNLIITKRFQAKTGKQTLWYSINYEELEEYELLITTQEAVDKQGGQSVKMSNSGCAQNEQVMCSKRADVYKEKETKQINYFKETNVIGLQDSMDAPNNTTNVFHKKMLIPQIKKKLKDLQNAAIISESERDRLLSEVLYHVLHRDLDKTIDDQHAINAAIKKIKERKWTTPRGMLNVNK